LTKRSETSHEKGESNRSCSDIGAIDDQLKSHTIGAQYDVLAAAEINQDMFDTWQREENDSGIISGRGLNKGLGYGWERRCAAVWKPNVMRLQRVTSGISKSSRAPTLQQGAHAPASA